MAKIGIDLGSSYCTVSWLNPQSGKVEAVKFQGDGSVKMPSTILATENGFICGFLADDYVKEAIANGGNNSEILGNYIPSLKRRLNPKMQEYFHERTYSHQQILTSFFQHIIKEAKKHCGESYLIDEATITHPVEFTKKKKELIKDAAFEAGLDKVNLMYEPLAAAYGFNAHHLIEEDTGLLVFDFGGGTIDVSYVIKHENGFDLAVEPKGNSRCGGQDIDNLLYEHFRHRIKADYGYDVSYDNSIDHGCLRCCKILKERFNSHLNYHKTEGVLIVGGKIRQYTFELSRDQFNSIICSKVNEAIGVANAVVTDVLERGLSIDKVLLIGGSSKLTLVTEKLMELTNVIPETCGESDIAVAIGAIALAQLLETRPPPLSSEDDIDYNNSRMCNHCKSKECFWSYKIKRYKCMRCQYTYVGLENGVVKHEDFNW